MKNIFSVIVMLLAITLMSCEKDNSGTDGDTGSIHIDVGSSINVKEFDGGLKTIPQLEDFKVNVFRTDGSLAMAFARVFDMPDTLEIAVGDYYVEAFSGNLLAAEFENPYYYGVSDVFTVSSNSLQSVTVSCLLSNTIVSVLYSETVVNSFQDYSATVSSVLGSLVFTKDETRKGYFQTSPLEIAVDLTYMKPDGTTVNRLLSGSIPEPLANRHYQISVDASIVDGMASFQIIQDSSEVLMEVVQITDVQDSIPDGGVFAYGDLLITEIMYDPAILSDTEGEWFEIYNNSGSAVNLQNLILTRDDTNMHTISDSIVLQPGEYYVFTRTLQATDVANKYVYGTAITLSNTGALLSIFNKELDGVPGELIFSVNYGATGFPTGSGASIGLNPNMLNPTDAVSGSYWCRSVSAYNTGDLGTPGQVNDACQ